jgi:hypothetical protein
MNWSTERLDDFAKGVDARFERVEKRMDDGFARVDRDIRDLRNWMIGGFGTMFGTMVGGFIALFLHGG